MDGLVKETTGYLMGLAFKNLPPYVSIPARALTFIASSKFVSPVVKQLANNVQTVLARTIEIYEAKKNEATLTLVEI